MAGRGLLGALAGVCFLMQAGTANAGAYENSVNLYNSSKTWLPLNYNDQWLAIVDPYSVFKVDNNNWDINIAFINNNNEFVPEETWTYRIDCLNSKFQTQGWRINGLINEYKGPLGIWIRNPTRQSLKPNTIMWTAREYLCGISEGGSLYYWSHSTARNDQLRGIIDQFWIKEYVVNIDKDDQNFRFANIMTSVVGGNDRKFSDFYVKCDRREMMDAVNGVATTDWIPVPPASPVEVLFEKICSGRFSYITYKTVGVTHPAPKPAPRPAPLPQAPSIANSNIDDAKRKCADLGFQAGTPKFGECVLKISE